MNRNSKFWTIKNSSTNNGEGEILLYGDIGNYEGWNDVTAKQFAQELRDIGDVSVLNVHINSVGGDVFAGQAIHSMLCNHRATVNVYVDGLAASIASVVAMAGDKVIMPSNSMMMIHNPWTGCRGNANDFRKAADDLDKIGDSIIAAYQKKCSKSADEIKAIMDEETWLTAKEAVELGFADVLDEGKQVSASINQGVYAVNGQTFDLSRFHNAQKLYNCTTIATQTTHKEKENSVMEITAAILAEKYPTVYAEVLAAGREAGKKEAYQAGVEAERARFKALDALTGPGCEEILNKARYETFASAEQVAMEVVTVLRTQATAQAAVKPNPLAAAIADAQALQAVGVGSALETEAKDKDTAERKAVIDSMVAEASRR